MADIEELLRDTLAEHGLHVAPATDAACGALKAARQRNRTRRAATTVAVAAACAVIATSAAVWHSTTSPRTTPGNPAAPAGALTPALAAPSTPSAMSRSTTGSATGASTAGPAPDPASLVAIFGLDYTPQPKGSSGFGGDYTLTPGSASAAGLPDGYHAAVSRSHTGPTEMTAQGPVDSLTELCQPMNEKGATSAGCTTETVNGKTVHRDLTEAPNTAVGTYAILRYLYRQPDHAVEYTELTIWNTAAPTSPEQRRQADTWLNTQSQKLATAATLAH